MTKNKTHKSQEDEEKKKERTNTRTHNIITEMIYCTEGENAVFYMCAYNKHRTKRQKEKEKNPATETKQKRNGLEKKQLAQMDDSILMIV
jgi:hypothetical protein